jgi:hypothetical protein
MTALAASLVTERPGIAGDRAMPGRAIALASRLTGVSTI